MRKVESAYQPKYFFEFYLNACVVRINTPISIELGKSRIRNGAVVGVITYIVGFLLAVVTEPGRVESPFIRGGFKFYNAHLVDFIWIKEAEVEPVNRLTRGIQAYDGIVQLITDGQLYWLVIPVVLLLLGGAMVTILSENANIETAVVTGSLITVGYLPLIVFGAQLIRESDDTTTQLIDLGTAAGVAGLVYPVVFGGLGGYLTYKILA